MEAKVSILHKDYPARVRAQVERKLEHLERFSDRIMSVRVVLERQHDDHRVEIVVRVARGAVLVVDSREGKLSAALEESVQRMERLLKRLHTKRIQTRRRPRAAS